MVRDPAAVRQANCCNAGNAASANSHRETARARRRRGGDAGNPGRTPRSYAAARSHSSAADIPLADSHQPECGFHFLGTAARRRARCASTRGVKVAAVGPATAGALLEHGIAVDVIPERFVAEGLLDVLQVRDDVAQSRVLYVTGEGARDALPRGLRELNADVTVVEAYRSITDGEG